MSEEPQDRNGSNKTAAGSAEGRGSRFLPEVLAILALVVVIIYDTGELFEALKVAEVAKNQSMFSIPTEIADRYDSCDYKYLFFCEAKSADVPGCESGTALEKAACRLAANGNAASGPSRWKSIPYVNVVLAAIAILPRLPDAVIHVLRVRWHKGSLEFSLGVVFVLAYATLMILALRQQAPMNLWLFAIAAVFGPSLLIALFWLFQQALGEATAAVSAAAAYLVSLLGLPTCLLICLRHDLGTLAKVAGAHH